MGLLSLILLISCMLGFSCGIEDTEPQIIYDYLEYPADIRNEDDYSQDMDDFPKNIILFLASGMSFQAIYRTRNEGNRMITDHLVSSGKRKTHTSNFEPGNLELGLKHIFYGSAEEESCEKMNGDPRNIISLAQKVGKYTGFITNQDVLSGVPPVFFGHEDCFDSSKSNLSVPSCHLQNAKLNLVFGQHQDDEDIKLGDHTFNSTCPFVEIFTRQWKREGFPGMFNSSDVNEHNFTTDGNVLGLFPIILKDDFITLVKRAVDLLQSNENGYFLVVYLKYPDVLKTVNLVKELIPPIIKETVNDNTTLILTSEYSCDGDCLRKGNTSIKEFLNQGSTPNISLQSQNELEKEKKDGKLGDILEQNENPEVSEETIKTAAEERIGHTMKESKELEGNVSKLVYQEPSYNQSNKLTNASNEKELEENPQFNLQSPVIQELQSKKYHKPSIDLADAISVTKEQGIKNNSKEKETSISTESTVLLHNITSTMFPITFRPEMDIENVIENHILAENALNQSAPVLPNQSLQSESYENGTSEDEDKPISTPILLNNVSISNSTTNLIDNLENQTSSGLNTRGKREIKSKVPLNVPIYAFGPMSTLFRGVKKQNHLWIFLKTSFCADEEYVDISNCMDDPLIDEYYNKLFANKSMKGKITESSSSGSFVKYTDLWAYLLLAWFFSHRFYL